MAKVLITALPEAKRALYLELHMTMGWTYQQIWLDLAGRGRGLQSRRSLRRVWTASQPPPGKSLEKYGTCVLKWSLLLRKAMPVAADRAKEVFMDALVRHGEYGEELNEVYKWERIRGQELTVEGVHEILVYEIGWREDRDWAQHEDAAEVRRMHGGGGRQDQGKGRAKGRPWGRGQDGRDQHQGGRGRGGKDGQGQSGQRQGKGQERHCTNCGKDGHTAEFCWQKGAKGKGNSGEGRPTLQQGDAETEHRFREKLCMHCASPDHWARDCPQNGPRQQQGKGRGRGKGQHRQVGAETSGVQPSDRDAGKSQTGKGTEEQGNPAKLPAQPGPSGPSAKPAAGRETQG